jgi:hypothetical protein
MKIYVVMFTVASLVAISTKAHADSVTVNNFSFENPALPNGDYQSDPTHPAPFSVPGWGSDPANQNGVQNFIGTGAYGNGATLPGTADGKQALFVNGNDVFQDVGLLKPLTTYTLTVAAGNQPSYGPGSVGAIELVNGTNASGTVLSSEVVGDLSHPISVSNFTDFTTSFMTGSSVGGDLTIVLALTTGQQINFDNVRLEETVVPEPSSLVALCGLGGMTLISLVLRRRRES